MKTFSVVAICPEWEDMSPMTFTLECEPETAAEEAREVIAYSVYCRHGASKTPQVIKECVAEMEKDSCEVEIMIIDETGKKQIIYARNLNLSSLKVKEIWIRRS